VKPRRILILTASTWREPARLRKQLTEVLAQDHEVVYVTLPYGLKKPKKSLLYRDGRVLVAEVGGPFIPLRWIFFIKPLKIIYEKIVTKKLNTIITDLESYEILISFVCDYSDLFLRSSCTRKIYVANDDHAAIAGSKKRRLEIERCEAEIAKVSDLVMTVSNKIAGKKVYKNCFVNVVYPGHNCIPISEMNLKINREAGVRGACFLGYIDWRIDFDLLNYLLISGWEITLIGPVVGVEHELSILVEKFKSGLKILSPVDEGSAPVLLSKFSVLLLPYKFKNIDQRDSIELPNKLFIYFSALRPVVATYMPNLQYVENGLVYMARNSVDFENLCVKSMNEDNEEFRLRRRRLSEDNSWSMKNSALQRLIIGNK